MYTKPYLHTVGSEKLTFLNRNYAIFVKKSYINCTLIHTDLLHSMGSSIMSTCTIIHTIQELYYTQIVPYLLAS